MCVAREEEDFFFLVPQLRSMAQIVAWEVGEERACINCSLFFSLYSFLPLSRPIITREKESVWEMGVRTCQTLALGGVSMHSCVGRGGGGGRDQASGLQEIAVITTLFGKMKRVLLQQKVSCETFSILPRTNDQVNPFPIRFFVSSFSIA